MSAEESAMAQRAAALRSEFDGSFALAPSTGRTPMEAFLAIGAGGGAYAMRLAEVAGLYPDRKVVALPGASSELLGIASFRGALVPIYDLRALLGYSAGPVPRWLVLAAPDAPIGLAFDRFEGYLRMPLAAIARPDAPDSARRHISETLHGDGQVRPIVDVAGILQSIKKRAQAGSPQRER